VICLSSVLQTFPAGRAGLGLLLLRAAVAAAVLLQSALDLARHPDPTIGTWVADALAVAAGLSLLAGFLTPIAAAVVSVFAAAMWVFPLPPPVPNLFASKPCLGFLVAVTVVVALLGPGAFSLDARLFGLREIIIPYPPPAPPSSGGRDYNVNSDSTGWQD
jgi:uncharacterized membrane protein YphA (DoxX/SURF4 family)